MTQAHFLSRRCKKRAQQTRDRSDNFSAILYTTLKQTYHTSYCFTMSSSTATSDNDLEAEEVSAGIENDASQKELQRIQRECTAMVGLLKNLEKEEHDLHCELKILAREAMLCGFAMDLVEPPRPKRRKLKKKQAAEVAKATVDTPAVSETTSMDETAEEAKKEEREVKQESDMKDKDEIQEGNEIRKEVEQIKQESEIKVETEIKLETEISGERR